MSMTVALVAVLALAPAQAGGLALTNVRTTYGILGPPRTDTRFLPGDIFVISFDIAGLRATEQGKVLYSIGMDVADPGGKVRLRQLPRDLEANLPPGAASLPAAASLQIGVDAPAGDYTVKVTVADRAAQTTQSFSNTYTLLPKAFGLVRLTLTSDPDGKAATPVAAAGKPLWIHFAVVDFGREPKGAPNLEVVMRGLDAEGRPAVAEPFVGQFKQEVPSTVPALPLQFVLSLDQPGKYTVELTATDKVTGGKAALSFPLAVVRANARKVP
jgi:hypothetical protein